MPRQPAKPEPAPSTLVGVDLPRQVLMLRHDGQVHELSFEAAAQILGSAIGKGMQQATAALGPNFPKLMHLMARAGRADNLRALDNALLIEGIELMNAYLTGSEPVQDLSLWQEVRDEWEDEQFQRAVAAAKQPARSKKP